MGYGTSLVITILLFSGIAIGITNFYTDMFMQYNTPGPEHNLSLINQTSKINQKVEDVQSKLTNTEGGGLQTVIAGGDVLLTGSISAVQILLTVPLIIGTMASNALSILGLPGWILLMITGIIGALIVLKVLSAILRSDI